jgi:hypothetical protein
VTFAFLSRVAYRTQHLQRLQHTLPHAFSGASCRRARLSMSYRAMCAVLMGGWLVMGAAAAQAQPARGGSMTAAPVMSDGSAFASALAMPGNTLVSRTVPLSSLGIHDVVALGVADSRREYYFPVPAGVPLSAAQLQLDADYLRGDGGRTTMLVSIDGAPVLARGMTQPQGDATATVSVSGEPHVSGDVQVGVEWASIINEGMCTDQTSIGNILRLAPSTRLSYRYDTNDIKDLRTAWSALPRRPAIIISTPELGAAASGVVSYDTAWRTAALMQREGMDPLVHAWPKVGDTVNLGTVEIPAALRALPAFAALAGGGSHVLANPAEVAALLAIAPAQALPADLIVMDDTLRGALRTSLDALLAQAQAVSKDDAAAMEAWQKRVFGPVLDPLAPGEARLVHFAGQAVIVVGEPQAVLLFAQPWRSVNVSDRMVAHDVASIVSDKADTVSLAALGAQLGTVNVLREAVWNTTFDLGALSRGGRLPDDVVLDLAGSPNTHGSGVVASVYLNDQLIGAKLLGTNGQPERLQAHIPRFTLAGHNLLRLSLQRQSDAGCSSNQGYPVAVLPGSHLTLASGTHEPDFSGMVARFASGATVMVPASYLTDATATLPRLARLANASGVVPQRAVLSVIPGGQAAVPKGPFLAVEVALADFSSPATIKNGDLTIRGQSDQVLYDVDGVARLRGVAVIAVEKSGEETGIGYRIVGEKTPVLTAGLQLGRGDVAVVDDRGMLKQLDTAHRNGIVRDGTEQGWLAHSLNWTVPISLIAAFCVLLLLAVYVRRRKNKQSPPHGK